MQFNTKYNLGDKVWRIWQGQKKVFKTCSFCKGDGVVTGNDLSEDMCPRCHGSKVHTKYENTQWNSDDFPITVGQVQVVSTKARGGRKAKYKEIYMCEETGVGGGTLHDVDRLWPSKEEASTQCKARNADLEKK